MAVSLSIATSQDSYNASTNSSVVTVTVTINWTTSSYNGYNPSGTLTIDGTSYGFSSNFNYSNGSGPVSVTGSVVACTKTVTIQHGSDGNKMLLCSASFDSGVGSGTVTAEASRYLTTSGSGSSGDGGGGGGGGGDSGEDSGESGGGDVSGGDYTVFTAEVTFDVAPHSSVSVYNPAGVDWHELIETVTESGERRYSNAYGHIRDNAIRFVFNADPGYALTECRMNGRICEQDVTQYLNGGELNAISLVSNVVPNSYKLSIAAGEGANVVVYRSSSEITAASPLHDGDVIYYDDVIQVNFSYNKGYILDTHTVNGATFESGNSIVVKDNLTVSATAMIDEQLPEDFSSTHIDIGTTQEAYQVFVDDGTTWHEYAVFVSNGTSWEQY